MSDKKKKKNEVTEDTEKDFPKTEEATPETEEKGEEKAETENKKESDELAKAKDQFVRLAADFDNYKKRTEAEKAALRGMVVSDTVQMMLPILDNLERAVSAAADEDSPLKDGVVMVLNQAKTAFENFGVKPDIVSFAKGVTCGYVQLGGVAVSRKIADYFDDNVLQCGLTYSGHPLACAAGVACLNYYKDNDILGNVNKSGKVLGEILEELKAKHKCVGDVRYIGLFSAVELVKDKATREPLVPYGGDKLGVMGGIIGKLKAKKFMTYSHENMILVCPPLIITPEQLREEMVKLDEVLAEVDATL